MGRAKFETEWQSETADTPMAESLVVDIRPQVQLTWPSKHDKKAPAETANAVLARDAYPGAAKYRVEISEIDRGENSARYHQIATRTVEQTANLPLASLSSIEGDTSSREYTLQVTALTAEGDFMSESDHAFEGNSFTLTDGRRLLNDDLNELAEAGAGSKEIRHRLDNDERLDAVVVLVRDGMLNAAQNLLDKVDSASAGRLPAVTGYLRATQGRCDEARILLQQAKSDGGKTCVPAAYWAACDKP